MFPNYIKIVFTFMISNVEKHCRTTLEHDRIVIAKSAVLDSNVHNLRWELGVAERNVIERTGLRRYDITPVLCLQALQINAGGEEVGLDGDVARLAIVLLLLRQRGIRGRLGRRVNPGPVG
uniref:Uncharacterized protein n=1 Tax=Arundo donax TaxID=35708 RepID=A0A0A9E717_ARUDO